MHRQEHSRGKFSTNLKWRRWIASRCRSYPSSSVVQVGAKSDRSKIDETTLPWARDSKFDVRKDVSLRGTSIMAPERTVELESKETGQQFSLRERAWECIFYLASSRRTILSYCSYIRNNNAYYVIKDQRYFVIRNSLLYYSTKLKNCLKSMLKRFQIQNYISLWEIVTERCLKKHFKVENFNFRIPGLCNNFCKL